MRVWVYTLATSSKTGCGDSNVLPLHQGIAMHRLYGAISEMTVSRCGSMRVWVYALANSSKQVLVIATCCHCIMALQCIGSMPQYQKWVKAISDHGRHNRRVVIATCCHCIMALQCIGSMPQYQK